MSAVVFDKAAFATYAHDEALGDGLAKLAQVAADDPNGYANELWYGQWALLAVRIDDRIVASMRRCASGARFPAAWKLTRWFRDPARNRVAVDAWARSKSRLKDSFVFTATTTLRKLPDERGPELLAAVIADPHDQAARLIYADWLTENGDDRGELIRLAFEPPRPELVKRTKQLLRSDGAIDRMMRASVSPFVINKTLRGGLVEGVAMTAAALATHGEHLFSTHPIWQLVVYCRDPEEYASLAQLPFLSRITELGIIGRKTLDSSAHLDLASVTSGPQFARVRRLHLTDMIETEPAWLAFLSKLVAPVLTEIGFSGTRPKQATVAAALRSRPALTVR